MWHWGGFIPAQYVVLHKGKHILAKMSKLLELLFSLDPQICLLGDFTNVSTLLRKSPQKFLELALCIVKKCKPLPGKLPIFRLISEMNSCIPLENITYTHLYFRCRCFSSSVCVGLEVCFVHASLSGKSESKVLQKKRSQLKVKLIETKLKLNILKQSKKSLNKNIHSGY